MSIVLQSNAFIIKKYISENRIKTFYFQMKYFCKNLRIFFFFDEIISINYKICNLNGVSFQ